MKSQKTFKSVTVLIALFLSISLSAQVNSVIINPTLDNTLYESATGTLSNALGSHIFAGRTNQPSGSTRRALIQFDIASSIPVGATILSVSLTMNVSAAGGPTSTVNLHRLQNAWGEGTSNANTSPGSGTAATNGDATWLHTFYDTSFWANAGGDFLPLVSGSNAVAGAGFTTWNSTAGMVADVEDWLANPANNFGWLLMGDESVGGSVKRFDSRNNANTANHPQLTITYEIPPACDIPAPFSSNVTFTSVKLNWNAIPGAMGYEIQGRKLGGSAISILISDGTTSFRNIAGLTAATTYVWQIKTICDTLKSNFSALDTFTTASCLTPDTSFTDNISGTSARLNWSLAPNATGYEIKGRKDSGPAQILNIGSGTQNSITVNSLTPNSFYEWQIRTKCPQGFRSPFSTTTTFITSPGVSAKSVGPGLLESIDFTIAPNPSNGSFDISLPVKPDVNDEVTITIYNILGKQIINKEITSLEKVNFVIQEKGYFLIHLKIGDQSHTKRLLIH